MTTEVLNPMTKTECREWIAALRSGKYRQTTGTLRERVHYSADGKPLKSPYTGYCCLGVEQKIHPEQCVPVTIDGLLQIKDDDDMMTSVRLPASLQSMLATYNDDEKYTFKEIADHVEVEILPGLKD